GVRIEDVLGIQPGRDPNRVVIIGGHIDSRVTDIMDSTSDAPGANDDASGVAVVIEAARLLSKKKFDATIVYAVFSGEEQGLFGGALLADTAKARGWRVTAMLNNDIVGNSIGQGGVKDANRVRVFSEGIRASEDLAQQMGRRAIGGEDDGPSRALAKAIDGVAAKLFGGSGPGGSGPAGFDVVLDQRPDRFGRGGDHEPFLKLGYPAVRFSVGAENWDAQHQDLRTGVSAADRGTVYGDTIDRMDFTYLAHVAAINIATIDRLADAPAAPDEVALIGDLSRDTKVSWHAVPGAAGYRVHWRRNDGTSDWTQSLDVATTTTTLKQVPVDDHFIGVSALAKDGAESLVTFGGRARR
ncbi:MAG: M20/M25/M40 family metallo-hydrolase, partial [Pseudomonadota bacterium]|nr:M20/M25/M40 family metallo-hydrolase [Pseudomonadota bacterium]